MQVRIDRSTGELLIGQEGFGPATNEAAFLATDVARRATRLNRSGTRNYYEAWVALSPDLDLGVTLGFQAAGRLQRISAKFVRREYRDTEWSRKMEDEIKGTHDRWLREQLGNPPYEFGWGRVLSAIEPHWHSANIVFQYPLAATSSTFQPSQPDPSL